MQTYNTFLSWLIHSILFSALIKDHCLLMFTQKQRMKSSPHRKMNMFNGVELFFPFLAFFPFPLFFSSQSYTMFSTLRVEQRKVVTFHLIQIYFLQMVIAIDLRYSFTAFFSFPKSRRKFKITFMAVSLRQKFVLKCSASHLGGKNGCGREKENIFTNEWCRWKLYEICIFPLCLLLAVLALCFFVSYCWWPTYAKTGEKFEENFKSFPFYKMLLLPLERFLKFKFPRWFSSRAFISSSYAALKKHQIHWTELFVLNSNLESFCVFACLLKETFRREYGKTEIVYAIDLMLFDTRMKVEYFCINYLKIFRLTKSRWFRASFDIAVALSSAFFSSSNISVFMLSHSLFKPLEK